MAIDYYGIITVVDGPEADIESLLHDLERLGLGNTTRGLVEAYFRANDFTPWEYVEGMPPEEEGIDHACLNMWRWGGVGGAYVTWNGQDPLRLSIWVKNLGEPGSALVDAIAARYPALALEFEFGYAGGGSNGPVRIQNMVAVLPSGREMPVESKPLRLDGPLLLPDDWRADPRKVQRQVAPHLRLVVNNANNANNAPTAPVDDDNAPF